MHLNLKLSNYYNLQIYNLLYVSKYLKMTTVMNEKAVKTYIKLLEDKIMKKVKLITKKVTNDDIVAMISQLLAQRGNRQEEGSEFMEIMGRNQEKIMSNLDEIGYLKRKIELEDQLTASFIKNLMKERNSCGNNTNTSMKRDNSTINLPLSRCEYSRMQTRLDSSRANSPIDKSPICHISSISRKDDEDSLKRYGVCATSRSRFDFCRYQTSQFAQQVEPDERQKLKALSKLRKLQKYVFEKENTERQRSQNKIWNYGVSPTKKRYKEQNQSLKAIQSSLVTHLQLLQKFREIPSIEGLVAREQILKKREKQLKDLADILQKKQKELNKKHSQMLRKEKSRKIL